MERADVVVLGAGSAGSAAAAFLAEEGLDVVLLDRLPMDEAGARWCNAVPGWCFDAARLPRPTGDERRGAPGMHLVAGWGPEQLRLEGQDVIETDMRLLTGRLQEHARDHGARLVGETRPVAFVDGVLQTTGDAIHTRWVVDATGLGGAGLVPRPRVPREELCTAVQEVRELVDRDAALAWFDELGCDPHNVVCFTGVAGGYSIVNVRIHDDEVAILTGSIPALGVPSGRVLLDRFAASQPWIGERKFGGGRAIPTRRPHVRLHHGDIAFLGDAAGQVYAAHGSGVGAHLVAARLLADTLGAGGTPADYARRWRREHGGELAASDVFARFSRTMPQEILLAMMRSGLMDPRITLATLEQRPPEVGPADVARLASRIPRAPAAAAQVLPVLARMSAMRAAWRLAPADPRPGGRWDRLVARLAGEGSQSPDSPIGRSDVSG